MSEMPRVLILIVNWNNYPDTKACLESISGLEYENRQVMVIDNGSTDSSARLLGKEFPRVQVVELEENLGFAGGNNVGLEYALEKDFAYVLLLNNDTILINDDFVGGLVQVLEGDQAIGAIGPEVIQIDGKTQLSILPYPSLGNTIKNSLGLYAPDQTKRQWVDSVSGCCVLVRCDAVKMAGILDENFFMYGEETEWFYRLRKTGWKVLYLPIKSIVHKGAASTKKLERQDVYIERRANVIYTLVKHNQRFQAISTLILMTILVILRSIKSSFKGNNEYSFSMLSDLWKAALDKWTLARGSRKYIKLSSTDRTGHLPDLK
jgi:GT2 family glycosyltransferase